MKTRLLPTGTARELAGATQAAVAALRSGQPVALPTETVYGLAADALRPGAVATIFEAKERPFFDPLIVHLPTVGWLERLTAVPPEETRLVARLTEAFWPGPLTLVLPRRDGVPDLVTSGLPTVAVRMSAHPVFAAVAQAFGGPLAAPSANRFGRISPTQAGHVVEELEGRIPLVLDGGPARHGVESTIVAISGGRLSVLRNGPVTRERLAEFAPLAEAGAIERPAAPGQMESHYAPGTPTRLLAAGERPEPVPGVRSGLLAWRGGEGTGGFEKVEILSPSGDLREAAARLFAALRRLDGAGLERLLIEPVPEEGLGVAIMDRLRKAAAPVAWRKEAP